jgi:DNA/RNA endonuclease G (NUC1)
MTRYEAQQYDSIHIWVGSVGEIKKIGIVSVPKQCWKVVYIKRMNTYTAYLFDNNNTKADGVKNNEVEVKLIEQITGFKFK